MCQTQIDDTIMLNMLSSDLLHTKPIKCLIYFHLRKFNIARSSSGIKRPTLISRKKYKRNDMEIKFIYKDSYDVNSNWDYFLSKKGFILKRQFYYPFRLNSLKVSFSKTTWIIFSIVHVKYYAMPNWIRKRQKKYKWWFLAGNLLYDPSCHRRSNITN